MNDAIIKLPVGGIEIKLMDNGGGSISSTLHSDFYKPHSDVYDEYDAAIDALESLILAHACEGVEIWTDQYVKGIETALEAIEAVHC